jgi:hypothetical protein
MHPETQTQTKRSPWLYIGLGCGGLLLLGVAGVVLAGYLVVRKVDEFQQELSDPEAREKKARQVLGAQRLPPGYEAKMTLSIPLVMDTVMLEATLAEGTPEPEDAEDGFTYFRMYQPLSNAEELRDYLTGKSDRSPGPLLEDNFELEVEQVLGRGELSLARGTARFVSQRGRFMLDKDERGQRGINSLVLFECPGSSHARLGVWFTPDPAPEASAGASELTGTPADEQAVRAFVSHFNPCQET